MKRMRRILLSTVLLISASTACGAIHSRRNRGNFDDTEIADDRLRRVAKISTSNTRRLELTKGKIKGGKDIIIIVNRDGSNSTDSFGDIPVMSSTSSKDIPAMSTSSSGEMPAMSTGSLGSSESARTTKKSYSSDKSSTSRLRVSKIRNNSVPQESSSTSNDSKNDSSSSSSTTPSSDSSRSSKRNSKSHRKQQKSAAKSRTMHSKLATESKSKKGSKSTAESKSTEGSKSATGPSLMKGSRSTTGSRLATATPSATPSATPGPKRKGDSDDSVDEGSVDEDSVDEAFVGEDPSSSIDEPVPAPSPVPETTPPTLTPTLPGTAVPSPVPETNPPTLTPTLPGTAVPSPVPETNPPTLTPTLTVTAEPSKTPRVVQQDEVATASYKFASEVPEPTGIDIFRLELATTAFYIGVYAEEYTDNPDTIFASVVAEVQELRYMPDAIPPIQIDWLFRVFFGVESTVIPTSDEVLNIIYSDQETLNRFVENFLQNDDGIWSSITTITFDDDGGDQSAPAPSLPATTTSSSTPPPSLSPVQSTDAPSETIVEATSASTESPKEKEEEFPSTNMEATLLFQFTSAENTFMAEPSQEKYDQLANAMSLYTTALLTDQYIDSNETILATATATMTGSVFTEEDAELNPWQGNFAFEIFFSSISSVIPTSESIFEVFQGSEDSLLTFLQEDYSWNSEGNVCSEVSDLTVLPLTPLRANGKKKKKGFR